MTARLARPEDAADLVRLNREFNDNPKVTIDQVAAHLAAGSDVETVLVAEADGRVVGFACMQMRGSICFTEVWADLTELYVEPAYRRRGLARQLMQLAEQVARKRSAVAMTLVTGQSNSVAQSFYCATGFVPAGEVIFLKQLVSP